MNKNPFTLMYGIASESVVSRDNEIQTVLDSFTNQNNMLTYLITGIRGTGKTVLLRTIEEILGKNPTWIVINLNPQGAILTSLANKLYDVGMIKKILGNIKISINLGIVTITRESGEKSSDPEIVIEHLLNTFKMRGINVLLSIDEVNDTSEFRAFINFYQTLIAKKYHLYLLMTALKENVSSLINDKAMTFLSRAPKIELEPLNLANIAVNYSEIFEIDYAQAAKMAKLTKGYAFAYQVLGYILYDSGKKEIDESIIKKYQKYLFNNGYNKFWNDLTNTEKEFMIALASSSGEKGEIIKLGFSSTNYSQYRRRLLEKGLVYMPKQGYLSFVLPCFKEYVLLMKEFEEQ